jgi:hypothetical protein
MALTQSAWTVMPSGKNTLIYKNTVTFTTAENDAYTLRTPRDLDPTKQWTLVVSTAATADGQAIPLDLWGGYKADFALTGNDNTVAATDGFRIKQVFDDIVLAVSPTVYSITFDPELPVADVVTVAAIGSGPKVRIPVLPYYIFNLNGGSTLNATSVTFYLVQVQR